MFYFIRHGKTDYSERNTKIYRGFGVNLSKLSKIGINQIKEMAWENDSSISERVLGELNKYFLYKKVIVACHGMMIQATTGGKHPDCGEVIEFEI